MFAEVASKGVLRAPLPVDRPSLERFLDTGGYPGTVTAAFRDGRIRLLGDCFRFTGEGSATTYTVALLANYFRDRMIEAGMSFSQKTVFSHPDKPASLRRARERGFRTYLYFVATDNPALNAERVRQRPSRAATTFQRRRSRPVTAARSAKSGPPCRMSRGPSFSTTPGRECAFWSPMTKRRA